jgi:hypothetical protein
MFKVIIVTPGGINTLKADTKREALGLVPWTRINGGKGSIQKIEGRTWVCRINS